jgi:large subunit ribosomal protein L10e
MPVRKALAYSKRHVIPYTRKSAKKAKSYIKTVPPQKIAKMIMGDRKSFENDGFKFIIKLVATKNVLIRDLALEAVRQYINKVLEIDLTGQYYFELKVYPHHIIRENKSAGGQAGADRVSTGMAQSFGTTIGRGALVKQGQTLFIIGVNTDKAMSLAISYFKQARPKLPGKCSIEIERRKK